MSNVSYSAVVLDDYSRQRILERFGGSIPPEWEKIADHMTINMGELDPKLIKYIGMPVRLAITDIAMDDKVIAVGVSGFESHNAKPHITLAVNRQNGGKPIMSNYLKYWKPIKRPFYVTGKITEVGYK